MQIPVKSQGSPVSQLNFPWDYLHLHRQNYFIIILIKQLSDFLIVLMHSSL